jgi:chromosome segregation ATPase
MKLNELIVADQAELTEPQKAFIETHQAIMTAGSIATEFAIKIAVNLKKMRDGKLYSAAGYSTFEEYSEDAVGLKKSQAYSYIKVVESFGDEIFRISGKINISKLELLARLTDEERTQVSTKINVEDVTVAKLKEQIKDLQDDLVREQDIVKAFESDNSELEDKVAELQGNLDERVAQAEQEAADRLKGQISKLESEIKALKSKPVEKETVKDEKTVAELAAAKKKLAEQEKAVKDNAAVLAEKETELRRLQSQVANAGDQALLRFKVKFEGFQTSVVDLQSCIAALSEEKQAKCKQAIKAVIERLAV